MSPQILTRPAFEMGVPVTPTAPAFTFSPVFPGYAVQHTNGAHIPGRVCPVLNLDGSTTWAVEIDGVTLINGGPTFATPADAAAFLADPWAVQDAQGESVTVPAYVAPRSARGVLADTVRRLKG